jgi:sugar phosphate isomerase/epimerase
MDRRAFLHTATTAALIAALAPRFASARGARHWPIGLQLFTVMTELERDFEGLLKTIAAIGYREVETIGSFGRDPAQVRSLLDKHGLVSPSQHLMPAALYQNFLQFTRKQISAEAVGAAWSRDMALAKLRDNVTQAIGWAQQLGQRHIVLQMMWPEQMKSRALVDEFCRALDMAGKLCADAGLTFNFHNHADEFAPRDGYVPYELILRTTNPHTVKLEMDIYWAVHGKADPLKLLKENPGRFVQCHVKDSTANGDFATVGQGVIDFRRIVPAARAAGVRHFYVEYDRADDPMAVVREAYTFLSRLH